MIRAGLLALALAAPAAAQQNPADCTGMSRHFVLCDEGTDWAKGEWEQYGDGATLHLGPLSLDGTEDWASRDDAATPEVEDAVAAILRGDDRRVTVAAHLTDRIDTPHLTVARIVQTESWDGDAPELRAWMVAATPNHRMMILMKAPADFPVDEMIRRSAEVAGLVREAPAE